MRVTHATVTPPIGQAQWIEDHVLEDEAHVHDYADPAHTHDTSHNHDGSYAALHAHPYSADDHSHDTSHDHTGIYEPTHSGHVHSHTAADVGAATSGHTHDTTHDHDADYADVGHTHPGGSEAFPVGSVFLSVVSTNPATLLGYGTWAAFGAGRMLVGNDGGSFGTDEATGGASTHTHAAHSGVISHTHPITDPGHVHDEFRNSATTGGLDGWAAGDTSTNTPTLTGYDTGSKVTGVSVNAPAGAVSELTHDSPSNLPPYIVVHMWKRTT